MAYLGSVEKSAVVNRISPRPAGTSRKTRPLAAAHCCNAARATAFSSSVKGRRLFLKAWVSDEASSAAEIDVSNEKLTKAGLPGSDAPETELPHHELPDKIAVKSLTTVINTPEYNLKMRTISSGPLLRKRDPGGWGEKARAGSLCFERWPDRRRCPVVASEYQRSRRRRPAQRQRAGELSARCSMILLLA